MGECAAAAICSERRPSQQISPAGPSGPAVLYDFLAGQDLAGRDVGPPTPSFIPVEGAAEGHPWLR